jgi:hypothetical protein
VGGVGTIALQGGEGIRRREVDEVVAWWDGAGACAFLEEDVVVGFGQEVEEGFVEEVGGDVRWDIDRDGVGPRGQFRPEVG